MSEDVREEPIATQAPLSSATASLSDFCIEGGSAVERYGKLLASLRKIDTFLASDLEQNSHAVRFDSEQVEIAIEQSETELVRRATEALTRLLANGITRITSSLDLL